MTRLTGMFSPLSDTERLILSDMFCSATAEIRHWHSLLPGYAGILADLESAEDDLHILASQSALLVQSAWLASLIT